MNTGAEPTSPQDDAFRLLIEFFKAVGDPARLRVAAAIAESPRTVTELSGLLRLKPAAVVTHVRRLEEAGLAAAEPGPRPPKYRLREERLRELAVELLESPRSLRLQGATDERGRILAAFFADGRLLSLPTGDKRWSVVLDEVVRRFDPARVYAEVEVNRLLEDIHPDYATLRRQLVDRGYLNRDKGVYWTGEGRLIEPVGDERAKRRR